MSILDGRVRTITQEEKMIGFSVGIDVNSNNGQGSLQQGIDKYRNALGGSIHRGMKFFDGGGGWPTAVNYLNGTNYGTRSGEGIPVICAKKHTKSTLQSAVGPLITKFGTVVIVILQEHDDEARAEGVTTYRNLVKQVVADRDALGWKGKVLVGCSANTYVELVAPGNPPITFQNMYGGLPLDLMGFDIYGNSYLPANYLLAGVKKCQAFAHSIGKPWALTEFGGQVSTKTTGDTMNAYAIRVKAVIDYCRIDPTCRWVNYWPQPAGTAVPGYIPLLGTPVEAVLKAEMAV